MWRRLIQRKDAIMDVVEDHKTFLGVTASLASAAVAVVGYQSRAAHQKKLEEQLEAIQRGVGVESPASFTKLERDIKELVSILCFVSAGSIASYFVGRRHGRSATQRSFEVAKKEWEASQKRSAKIDAKIEDFRTKFSQLDDKFLEKMGIEKFSDMDDVMIDKFSSMMKKVRSSSKNDSPSSSSNSSPQQSEAITSRIDPPSSSSSSSLPSASSDQSIPSPQETPVIISQEQQAAKKPPTA